MAASTCENYEILKDHITILKSFFSSARVQENKERISDNNHVGHFVNYINIKC